MKIIKPLTINDAILTSSTVAENDYAAWASGTAYTTGQKVIRTTTHKIYEALQNSTGKTPESEPTYWLDLGATNRWKMFDAKVGTSTVATTSMAWVLTPGVLCTGIALLELVGNSVTVQVDTEDGVVYDLTSPIPDSSWFDYFFDDIERMPFLVLTDLPLYSSSVITITVSGATGTQVGCGVCVLGRSVEFADAVQHGAIAGIQDYSAKGVDDFGNSIIVERAWSKRAQWEFVIKNSKLNKLQRTLAEMRATPAVYIGSETYDQTVVYGFFKNFEIVIEYPGHSVCSIELEGLI